MCLIVSLLFLNNNIGEQFRAVWLQIVTLLVAATGNLRRRAGRRSPQAAGLRQVPGGAARGGGACAWWA